jgi:hypothetical protein
VKFPGPELGLRDLRSQKDLGAWKKMRNQEKGKRYTKEL